MTGNTADLAFNLGQQPAAPLAHPLLAAIRKKKTQMVASSDSRKTPRRKSQLSKVLDQEALRDTIAALYPLQIEQRQHAFFIKKEMIQI